MCLPMLHQDLKRCGPSIAKMSYLPASGFLLISRITDAWHQARLTRSIWMVYGLLPTSPIRSQFMVCCFPFPLLVVVGLPQLRMTLNCLSLVAITTGTLKLQICSICLTLVIFLGIHIIFKLYKQLLIQPKGKKNCFLSYANCKYKIEKKTVWIQFCSHILIE